MSGLQSLRWPGPVILAAAALALVGAGMAGGFLLASRAVPSDGTAGANGKAGEVLYWYDPMVPDQHFDKPGKSPFMDMELVPRYAGASLGAAEDAGVRIDPGVIQNLGVRFATITRETVSSSVTVSGVVRFNERDVAIVQTKVAGFVERSQRRAVGDMVRTGEPLIDLRAPEWTGALGEYLALSSGKDQSLADAGRRRLATLGIPDAAIRDADSKGVAPVIFTLRAPIGGAITALDVREGMTLAAGAPVATINGLSPVWLVASVPQSAAGHLKPGAIATVRLSADAEAVQGRIDAVLPAADASSRAVEVRVALPNPDGRLRPGMTAEIDLTDADARDVLLAPTEAVIRTGRRAIAIVVLATGEFAPTEIQTGANFGDRIEIVSGLSAGQKVVASGQFLIDSEASLTGVIARLKGATEVTAPAMHSSSGNVTAIDEKGVTIAHAPVASLDWPSMTMRFEWNGNRPAMPISVGDEVTFQFSESGAGYVIETISLAGAPR